MGFQSKEEDEKEDIGGVDARRIRVSCPGIRPNEKSELREALQDVPVWEGLDFSEETKGFEGEVLDTEPTAGSGFGRSQVVVTKDTLIQIESE